MIAFLWKAVRKVRRRYASYLVCKTKQRLCRKMEVSGMDKKYDFRKTEKELQDLWEEEGIYRYQNGRDRKVFSIDTPPPTVSGKLHIGHV